MPGLFGSSAPGQVYDPSALSPMDKMAVFGAMLKDIGNGGQSDNIMQARQMLLGQQMARSQMGLIGAALGGDNPAPAQPEQITVPGAPTMTADAAPTQPAGYGGARPGLIGGGAPSRSARAMAALATLKGDYKGAYDILHPQAVDVREGSELRNPITGELVAKGPAKTGVSEGFGWRVDPQTGSITWEAQRPMTYDDILNLGKFQHQLSQDAFTNKIAAGHLNVDVGNLGVNQHRLQFDVGKTPAVTPPAGFVVDQK